MELRHEEIKALDLLYQKWEQAISKKNEKILRHLCRANNLHYRRPRSLAAIDFNYLKKTFVGIRKPYKTIWSFFLEVARIIKFTKTDELRIKMPSGAILI